MTTPARFDAIVSPSHLEGIVPAIASKSVAHRLLLLAATARTPTTIVCPTTSADIEATIACVEALGATVTRDGDRLRVSPITEVPSGTLELDCGESGSTLRFVLPLCCALGVDARLLRRGRLATRPMGPLVDELVAAGATIDEIGDGVMRTHGTIRPGEFILPGDVSSQYVTGLLMALPLLGETSRVYVSKPVESRPYIDITLDALARFGMSAATVEGREMEHPHACYEVKSGRGQATGELVVDGDWSNAAFWLAAGAMGANDVTVTGLSNTSAQGDRAIMAALAMMGCQVTRSGDAASARSDRGGDCSLPVSDIPDLVPPLAAVAAQGTSTVTITGAERLRAKESDRLETVSAGLGALGADITQTADGLVIRGTGKLEAGEVDAANDHRIAMMGAIAATRATGPVTIHGAECVSKSYPTFFDDLRMLGAAVELRERS